MRVTLRNILRRRKRGLPLVVQQEHPNQDAADTTAAHGPRFSISETNEIPTARLSALLLFEAPPPAGLVFREGFPRVRAPAGTSPALRALP